MKKILLLLLAILTVSCDRCYLDELDNRYGNRNVISEEKLIGSWGCTDIWFGIEQVKMIDIQPNGLAIVQLQDGTYTNRYYRTYKFAFGGRKIMFINTEDERERFTFSILDYLTGSLFLRDSMGIHEVRLYGSCLY